MTHKNNSEGCHEDGLGWAPDGTFCGECSNVTCKGCSQADKKEE